MIGVVDVGGGLRGIYGAGVFDYCMDHHIRFDYCIGVSAGSANILSYAANQRGRNYDYYIRYSFRKEYMSAGNFIRSGSYLGMDYIYGTLYNAGGERPLNYPAVVRSRLPLRIVATSARTGEPVYFTQSDLKQDCYDVLKASCSLPVVNHPYMIGGEPYYDGGISDPIPVGKALRDGCDRLVVILTKPRGSAGDDRVTRFFSRFIRGKYPKAAERMGLCNALYRTQLEELGTLERDGRALVIAPKSIYDMGTLTKDAKILQRLYDDAQEDARAIDGFFAG